MATVSVRSLAGKRLEVPCPPEHTLRQLKQALGERDAALAACKLFLRGKQLEDSATVGSLALQPGEFMVAIEVKRQARRAAAGSSVAPAASSVASAAQRTSSSAANHSASPAPLRPAGAAGAADGPACGGGGFLPAEEPAGEQPATSLSSPNKLDSLLPGYLSRPHASPMKARQPTPSLLPPPLDLDSAIAGGSSSNASGAGQQQAGGQLGEGLAAPPGAATLLQLAAARYGPVRPSDVGPESGVAGATGTDAGDPLPALGSTLQPSMQQAAAAAAAKVTGGMAAAVGAALGDPPGEQAVAAPGGAGDSTTGLWVDLHEELISAQQAQHEEQGAAAEGEAAPLEAAGAKPGKRQRLEAAGAATAGPGPSKAAAAHHSMGAGAAAPPQQGGRLRSKRARHGGGGSNSGAQPSTGGRGSARPTAGGRQQQGGAAAAAGKEGEVPSEQLVRLPLPEAAAALERGFGVLSAVHTFLARQHIQASWRNVREAMHGAGLGAGAAGLRDAQLMAAVCPGVISVREHYRLLGLSYTEPWKKAPRAPPEVGAALAAAAAAEAGEGPVPHPMQVRTDGAGTVLEGEEETHILEIVDPGRGFSKGNPIPASFLRQLSSGALGITQLPDAAEPGGGCADVPGASQPVATASGKEEEPARGGRRERENAGARQAWAFRLALLRTLRWLEQERSAAAQQQQQQERGPAAASGINGPAGEPPAAPQQSAAPTGQAQQRSGDACWDPCFAAALDSVTQEDLWRAALALRQADDEAAAQHAGGPLDALDAARAAAAAATGAGGGAGSGGGVSAAAAPAGRGSRGPARPPTIMKSHEPCRDTTQLGTEAFLDHLRSLPWYTGQAVHCQRMPARPARHAEPAAELSPAVLGALRALGAAQLFTHQAQAVDLLLQGRHTVVATSTASGKSLCYNVPVLQALATDPGACALHMFPTKALAQDQLRALRELTARAFGEDRAPAVEIYDGDTPMGDRPEIRDRAQLLITNPDMLHLSVLPVHRQFARLLANLKYVIVDEGHTYKGVFGCHTALVLRRLRRLCERLYNSRPTFVVTTATVANPREHACQLLGVESVEVVSEDGSPHGPKCFVLWNPPLQSEKRSSSKPAPKQAKRVGKRALEEHMRMQVREAAQERGRGSQLGPSMSEGDWVAAVKLGRRRAAVEAAVLEAVAGPGAGPESASGPEPSASAPEPSASAPEPSACAPEPSASAHEPSASEPGPGPRRETVGEEALGASGSVAQREQQHGQQQQQQQGQQGQRQREDKEEEAAAEQAAPPGHEACCSHAASAVLAADVPGSAAAQPRGPPRPLLRRGTLGLLPAGSGGSRAGQQQQQQQQRRRYPGWAGRWRAGAARGAAAGGSVAIGGEQDEVQSRLPSSASWKARSGTAGTPQDLRRSSPIVELSLLLAECVQHGLRTIAFCHTRKLCELVTAYVREMLRASAPALEGTISVYRAGYSPAERREIERALFQGQLRAVAATNALELGIDVGSLDVTLHLGFPGSVASLWQQAGRAGRREQASMSIYVAWDGPLDQYFMHHPDHLFSRPIEKAQLDPRNPGVLEGHLACAAAEAPLLLPDDEPYFGEGLQEVAAGLAGRGVLGRHPETPPSAPVLHYLGTPSNPASRISLRAIDPERFSIVNEATGEVIEEIEESKAFFEVYDGAVYMFQGRTYLCKKLDLGAKVAAVRPADLKYYTTCVDYTDVHVTGGKVAFPSKALAGGRGDSSACCGEALVTTRWLGFNRVWRGSGQVFDTVDLFLPDVQFATEAAYIRVPPSARQRVKEAGLPFRDGLHAASHALLNVLPLYLMSNPNDVGTECDNPYDTRYRPERLLIYDRHPGGIGLAAAACPIFLELLRKALELVEGCDCQADTGCPACIQHTCCAEYNTVLHKRSAAIMLGAILEAEQQAQQAQQDQPGRRLGEQAQGAPVQE